MRIDWRRGGSTISNKALGAIDKNEALGVLESKVLVPAKLWA